MTMTVEIADLTEENLRDAPEWDAHPFSCKYCTYWGFPEECVDPATGTRDDVLGRKLEWLRRTRQSSGNCGKIAYVDGVGIGYAQYAPPECLPNAANYLAGPASPEAVLISCLFIPRARFRRLGLGSRILAEIVAESRRRGIRAVETFAKRGGADNPSGPEEFYLRHGFGVLRDDADFPLLRLDL